MSRKRSNITGLSSALSTSPRPIYAMDRQRRIIYANAACAEWLKVPVGDLLEAECDYHCEASDVSGAGLGNALCPPPETFQGRRTTTVLSCPLASGGLTQRSAEFFPVGATTDGRNCVLAIVGPQDERPSAGRSVVEPSSAQLHRRLSELRQELGETYRVSQILGDDPATLRAREQVRLAVESKSRVVVTGPSGSGREHIARTIHYGWGRQVSVPLAPLACHLLDADLLEATITSFMAGCAELATEQPAALLLLEVDQLPPDGQAALAGILSIQELNVRTIATSRASLELLSEQGNFRRDLALSLATIPINIPPLRERPSDIPLLAQHFLERQNVAHDRQLAGFTEEAMDQLVLHPWPGNVNELHDLVSQSCQRAQGPWVKASDLPDKIRLTAEAMAHPVTDESIVLDEFLEQIEKELLQRALGKAKGNKAKAARLLGIPRARVIRRAEHFGLGDR